MSDINKVVLAYSGGLDTSVIVRWLQETYDCEVVTFTADIGQGEEVEPARAKAEALGVKEIYIDDLREEYVRDFVFPMFRANAIYEGEYLLGTSIARPLIAKRLIEIANETGADAISFAAAEIADTLDLAAIVCFTASGSTGLRAARTRPAKTILTLSPVPQTARRLAMTWGTHCVITPDAKDLDDVVDKSARAQQLGGRVDGVAPWRSPPARPSSPAWPAWPCSPRRRVRSASSRPAAGARRWPRRSAGGRRA